MPKFVVLRHDVSPDFVGNSNADLRRSTELHFDWMFQVGEILRTWATVPIDSLLDDSQVQATQIADHRLKYLEYEGDIGGGRGSVAIVVRGDYSVVHGDEDRFCVAITWQDSKGHTHNRPLDFYRSRSLGDSSEDSGFFWRLKLG